MSRPGLQQRSDEGATLVELLVVMVLTSLVLAAVATVFTSATRGLRTTQVMTSTQADARTATEAITRSLRVAVVPPGTPAATSPFVSATATSVSFYANLQRTAVTFATSGPTSAPLVSATLQPPTLVAYALSGGCLTESRTPATPNTGSDAASSPYLWLTANTTTKCLAPTTATPTFTYFTSGVIGAGASLGAPLTTAQAATVVSVGVDLLVVDPKYPDVPGSRTSDRVSLVNVLANQSGAS